jgi:hypothetical protein
MLAKRSIVVEIATRWFRIVCDFPPQGKVPYCACIDKSARLLAGIATHL